jgi:hypothetical protein
MEQQEGVKVKEPPGKSGSAMKRAAYIIMDHSRFQSFIIFIIVVNGAFMAAEDEHNEEAHAIVFFVAEVIFSGVFLIEMIIKMLAMGVFSGKNSYFTAPDQKLLNMVDCFIVVMGIIDISLKAFKIQFDVSSLTIIRLVRLFRPLRIINAHPKFKLIVGALQKSWDLLSKALILVVIFLFGTIGVQAFHGRLHLYDPAWISFDHIGVAMFTIVNIMTLDNWQDILLALNEKANPFGSTVFMFTVTFIGSFFLLNLTITVLKSSYVQEKKEELKERRTNMLKTLRRRVNRARAQGLDLKNLQAVSSYHMVPKKELCAKLCGAGSTIFVTRKAASKKAAAIVKDDGIFDRFVLFSIIVNTIVLGIETYYRNTETDALTYMNYAFTVIFGVEMLLKLTAMGFAQYWRNPYTAFDGVICITSIMEVALTSIPAFQNVTVMRAGRILRMLRVLRATKLAGHLTYFKRIIEVFKEAADEFGVVVLLLGLFVFIYSVMGMSLYGGELPMTKEFNFSAVEIEQLIGGSIPPAGRHLSTVSADDCDADCMEQALEAANLGAFTVPGVFISPNQRANFDDFASAALVVFQIITMEDWQGVMFRCLRAEKALPKWLSVPFFWSCIILGALIILELFLAILLGTFEQLFDQEKRKEMQVKKRALKESIDKGRKNKKKLMNAAGVVKRASSFRR